MFNLIKKIDVLYWVLRWTILHSTFRILHQEVREEEVKGAEETLADIQSNTHKHSLILYAVTGLILWVLPDLKSMGEEQINILLTIILPIVSVMGLAWYVISFGAVPAKHLFTAFIITLTMFFPFVLSMALMGLVILILLPFNIAVLVIAMEVAVYIASVLYDTMDLLKAGIDEAGLKFYLRATDRIQKLEESGSSDQVL